MNIENNQEILTAANKLQWVLGESLFRAKKLKDLLDQNPEIKYPVIVNMSAFLKALTKFSDSYRHDIADRIRDQIKG